MLDGEPQVIVERPEGLLSEVAKWQAEPTLSGAA